LQFHALELQVGVPAGEADAAITAVWASLYSRRAVLSRRAAGVGQGDACMAVLIMVSGGWMLERPGHTGAVRHCVFLHASQLILCFPGLLSSLLLWNPAAQCHQTMHMLQFLATVVAPQCMCVQELVAPDVSFVLHTARPRDSNHDIVLAELAPGQVGGREGGEREVAVCSQNAAHLSRDACPGSHPAWRGLCCCTHPPTCLPACLYMWLPCRVRPWPQALQGPPGGWRSTRRHRSVAHASPLEPQAWCADLK
jgi:hypothetical protein